MDRLGFFKQGLASVMDAASSIIGLKKAADSFVEVVDEALSNIKTDIGFHLPSIDAAIYDGGASVLENLAAIGYSTIEVGTYKDGKLHYKTPEELKELARKANVKITAAHLNHLLTEPVKSEAEASNEEENVKGEDVIQDVQTEEIAEATINDADKDWWLSALTICKDLGCKYVTMAQFPENPDQATIARYAKYFDTIGEMAAEQGMKFCFHPTKAELTKSDDSASVFEMLAEQTDKEKVWFEIDTLEAVEAATDVCELLKQHDKRVLLLHLHDYGVAGDSGLIDFDSIIKEGIKRGLADIFIEVRDFHLPAMNCVERSYYYVDTLPSIRY
ncbi:MAG: sugar phosphate isomerase/epimerase [Alistipes sp.]|nr:sugar phosphate isomerase/epimerase [Alistipes sp.]